MLNSQIETDKMERRVLRAFREWLKYNDNCRVYKSGQCAPRAFFEHGHWWIGAESRNEDDPILTFDVVDAEGGMSVDGFDFERV